jgi:hypothetical protein
MSETAMSVVQSSQLLEAALAGELDDGDKKEL